MKAAISIFVFLISAGIAVLYLVNVKELEKTNASQQTFGVCGGPVYSDSYFHEEITEEIKKGKALFNANCAACHKLDQRSTGPGLRGVSIRYEEEKEMSIDSFFYMRRFHREKNTRNSCFISPEITGEDIKNILIYTN